MTDEYDYAAKALHDFVGVMMNDLIAINFIIGEAEGFDTTYFDDSFAPHITVRAPKEVWLKAFGDTFKTRAHITIEDVRGLMKPEGEWDDSFIEACKKRGYNAALEAVIKLMEKQS